MNKNTLLTLIFCCYITQLAATVVPTNHKTRLTNNWEFIRQEMGSIWEVLPHCFNAEDALDPDVNYYQGAGWYRTQLELNNPYPQGAY